MTEASTIPNDKSNLRVVGFNAEAKTKCGTLTKKVNEITDIQAWVYQVCNAALMLDMEIGTIILYPQYGSK